MATVNNQKTLRETIADWLNRSDLAAPILNQFIEMGEAKVYEELRVPSLEKATEITVTDSHITIPGDFLELIEIRKKGSGNDDIILSRTDTRNLYASDKHSIANSFARDGNRWVVTDSAGNTTETGDYVVKYYKVDNAIGSVYAVNEVITSTQAECTALKKLDDSPSGATFVPANPVTGFGACTINDNDVEKSSWLLTDYELILFAACSIASEYLGNDEDVARYTRLYLEKLRITNMRAANAELKGANVSMRFQNFQGL